MRKTYTPVPPEGAPTLKRTQYKSRLQADAQARYLNIFGSTASRYLWSVRPHPDGGWELWKTPIDGGATLATWIKRRDERLERAKVIRRARAASR